MLGAKMGRPPIHGQSKHNRLEIRLNDEQLELLNSLAKKHGLSRTETIFKALELLAKKK